MLFKLYLSIAALSLLTIGRRVPAPIAPQVNNQPILQQIPLAVNAQESVKIQVALLLDTSNSMDGLIDQAKSQLWKMVNKLADAQRQNEGVILEIALYEYGNQGLDGKKGYLRKVQAMQSDLDGLSEQLFALRTNGGNEYCGWVIQTALDSLGWSGSPKDLRMVIVAGNEPFDQGPVNFRTSCENAFLKDILVNTIFCGNIEEGRRTHWFDCAQIAKGRFMNIDTDQKVRHVPTPYDTTLLRINEVLNSTYVGYGVQGESMKLRQKEQDTNAAKYGSGNMSQRVAAKSKKSYLNDDWDLVDAYVADSTFVNRVKEEELPKPMRGKSKTELTKEIKTLLEKRTELRKQLVETEKKMQIYTAEALKNLSDTQTLDQVLIQALVEQAVAKGFEFK
jgi:hypothetical protein